MKNFVIVIFLILSYFAQAQEPTKVIIIQEKNPAYSFLLSFAVPGSGQMYNGQVKKGLIIFGSEALLLSCGTFFSTKWYLDKFIGKVEAPICFSLAAGLYLFQVVQAPLFTEKYNIKKGFNTDKRKVNLKYHFSYNSAGITLNF